MLKRLNVPTHHTKEYIQKYLSKDVELAEPKKAEKKHVPYFPNVLCRFYSKNGCTKGSDCIFSHDLTLLQTEKVEEEVSRLNEGVEEHVVFTSPFI